MYKQCRDLLYRLLKKAKQEDARVTEDWGLRPEELEP